MILKVSEYQMEEVKISLLRSLLRILDLIVFFYRENTYFLSSTKARSDYHARIGWKIFPTVISFARFSEIVRRNSSGRWQKYTVLKLLQRQNYPFPIGNVHFCRLDKLARTTNWFQRQIRVTGDWSFKRTAAPRKLPTRGTPLACYTYIGPWVCKGWMQWVDRLDVVPSILVDSTATLFIRHWPRNAFKLDSSLTIHFLLFSSIPASAMWRDN